MYVFVILYKGGVWLSQNVEMLALQTSINSAFGVLVSEQEHGGTFNHSFDLGSQAPFSDR